VLALQSDVPALHSAELALQIDELAQQSDAPADQIAEVAQQSDVLADHSAELALQSDGLDDHSAEVALQSDRLVRQSDRSAKRNGVRDEACGRSRRKYFDHRNRPHAADKIKQGADEVHVRSRETALLSGRRPNNARQSTRNRRI